MLTLHSLASTTPTPTATTLSVTRSNVVKLNGLVTLLNRPPDNVLSLRLLLRCSGMIPSCGTHSTKSLLTCNIVLRLYWTVSFNLGLVFRSHRFRSTHLWFFFWQNRRRLPLPRKRDKFGFVWGNGSRIASIHSKVVFSSFLTKQLSFSCSFEEIISV